LKEEGTQEQGIGKMKREKNRKKWKEAKTEEKN